MAEGFNEFLFCRPVGIVAKSRCGHEVVADICARIIFVSPLATAPIHQVMRHLLLSIPFFFCFLLNCQAQKTVSEVKLGGGSKCLLLDSTLASQAIVFDHTDGFFEKVTMVEMSIQLKKPVSQFTSRAEMLTEYVAFLKTDVENFTPDESRWVAEIWKEVGKTTNNFQKNLLPKELKLIKTKGRHYGDGVFYTRENCIVIPENELEGRNREQFLGTMYHELFHVISRLNHPMRDELYGLIGFRPIGRAIQVPAELADRIFFNPDGVDYAQVIKLRSDQDQEIMAVPVIFSNSPEGYSSKKKSFFGYLDFNLFQVKERPDGSWHLLAKPDGSSTIDLANLKDEFYRQIKDNTDYIIHPDEVIADNFGFLLRSQNDPKVTEKFSPDGQKLLADMAAILKK